MRLPRVRTTALVVLLVVASVAAVGASALRPRPVSQAEAVRRAERFVARNGYTDLPAADPTGLGLDPEPVEWVPRGPGRLRGRRGTLEPTAAYAVRDPGGWVVAFRSKQDPGVFRGVWVGAKGDRVRMLHQDLW